MERTHYEFNVDYLLIAAYFKTEQSRVGELGGEMLGEPYGYLKLDLGGLLKIGGEGVAWRLNTMVT